MTEVQDVNQSEGAEVANQNTDGETSFASWMNWQYDFSKKMNLRYAVDVQHANPQYGDNFVKSIRMSPNGCSFIYSADDGMVRYIDLRNVDFWGCEKEKEDQTAPVTLSDCHSFSHTEIVYGMDWFE